MHPVEPRRQIGDIDPHLAATPHLADQNRFRPCSHRIGNVILRKNPHLAARIVVPAHRVHDKVCFRHIRPYVLPVERNARIAIPPGKGIEVYAIDAKHIFQASARGADRSIDIESCHFSGRYRLGHRHHHIIARGSRRRKVAPDYPLGFCRHLRTNDDIRVAYLPQTADAVMRSLPAKRSENLHLLTVGIFPEIDSEFAAVVRFYADRFPRERTFADMESFFVPPDRHRFP